MHPDFYLVGFFRVVRVVGGRTHTCQPSKHVPLDPGPGAWVEKYVAGIGWLSTDERPPFKDNTGRVSIVDIDGGL